MKDILGIYDAESEVWVGDAFPTRSMMPYQHHCTELNPLLIAGYSAPHYFTPTKKQRGIGPHPHRGFETVTIVYQGEVAHRDTTGSGGIIGPGEVQWMTAGSGILHEEFHSPAFSKSGGTQEMVQLWVNLPAKDKMTTPGYQALTRDMIPEKEIPHGTGKIRIIAGEYAGMKGPARTHSPMMVWDIRLNAGHELALELPEGWPVALAVLHGPVTVSGRETANHHQTAILSSRGTCLRLKAGDKDAVVLLMSGETIREPIAAHGPFVMNTKEELQQAGKDFYSGKFGTIPPQ